MIDIVFPSRNEKAFIAFAEKLGLSGLCFAYYYRKREEYFQQQRQVAELGKETKLKLCSAALVQYKDLAKVKGLGDMVITKGSAKNRVVLEQGLADMVYELENIPARDFIYFRNSGITHVLAGYAAKTGVMVGFSFASILSASPEMRLKIFGRMQQNIMLCQKYKVTMAIASFARKPIEMRYLRDAQELFICLGMDERAAKESLHSIEARIRENEDKRSPGYVTKGVRIVK